MLPGLIQRTLKDPTSTARSLCLTSTLRRLSMGSLGQTVATVPQPPLGHFSNRLTHVRRHSVPFWCVTKPRTAADPEPATGAHVRGGGSLVSVTFPATVYPYILVLLVPCSYGVALSDILLIHNTQIPRCNTHPSQTLRFYQSVVLLRVRHQ